MKAKCCKECKVRYAKTIGRMEAGQWGWTISRAYKNGKINLAYIVNSKPGRTEQMKVKCIDPGKLYHAWSLEDHQISTHAKCISKHSPRRQKCAEFRDWTSLSDTFTVWTDLAKHTLEDIPGVCRIVSPGKRRYYVMVDPRYSVQEIKDEMERLAFIFRD